MITLKDVFRYFLVLLALSSGAAALAAEAERRTIKLGFTASETGEFRQLSEEFVSGIKMWADDLLDRGADPIAIVSYDDESSPERAAELYERLITEDEVDLLIGPFSSSLVLAVAPVVERHDFPMVVEATAPEVFQRGYRNIFGIYTPASYNMLSVLEMARERGLSTLALVHQESAFPAAVSEGARQAAPGKGFSIVFEDSYPVGAESLDALATALAAERPDLIVLGAYLKDSILFVEALERSGYAPKMIAVSGAPSLPGFGQALGRSSDGVIATTQWMRDGRIPGSFDFGFRYRKRYGFYPSYNAAGGYAAGQIIEAAARLARLRDYSTPQEIRDGMREQLSSMKFQSLLGSYRVDETGMQIGNPIYVIQWQGPHRSLIAPEEIARWELKFPFVPWEER